MHGRLRSNTACSLAAIYISTFQHAASINAIASRLRYFFARDRAFLYPSAMMMIRLYDKNTTLARQFGQPHYQSAAAFLLIFRACWISSSPRRRISIFPPIAGPNCFSYGVTMSAGFCCLMRLDFDESPRLRFRCHGDINSCKAFPRAALISPGHRL